MARLVEAGERLAVVLGVLPQEVRGQQRNVFAAIAQRRQADLDGVQAEEQILAEAALGDFGVEVGIGRGEDADVHAARLRGADALELAGLERAQQLGLQVLRDVGDLVEEQRAAVGHFEAADAVALGVGERALDVAEQLAFEDALGQAAGVHRDQRTRGAQRDGVQRLRDQSLAGAVFAGDEDVGVGRADARDHVEHRAHGRRFARSVAESARRAARGSRPPAAGPCAARGRVRSASCRIAESRALSHGFWMKSRAPRRMASTASSTQPHAVITITGSVVSSVWMRLSRSRPSCPEVVSRV